MENILEIKNLKKTYKEFSLNNISFSLPRGYIMGFIGPNGAGKSSTIKSILNLIEKDGGNIKILGLDSKNNEEYIKDQIGYVGEDQYFYEDMTVDWTKNFISKCYTKWDDEKYNILLKQFNISKTKKIKELSKGMKVKLSLAFALSHNPELLILDEPTSGLDPVIRNEILDLLLDFIQDDQKSILFSSHITEDIEKIADYVTYIVNGKVILSEEKESLLSKWKKVHIPKKYLTNSLRKYLINVEENIFGVSALVEDYTKLQDINNDFIKFENVSLDEILVAFVKEDMICSA